MKTSNYQTRLSIPLQAHTQHNLRCEKSGSFISEYIFLSLYSVLLSLARSPLLLHPLTTRRFSSHLLDFAEPVAVGVAVRAGGFHRVDAGLLVGGCGGVPGFRARGGADCGL